MKRPNYPANGTCLKMHFSIRVLLSLLLFFSVENNGVRAQVIMGNDYCVNASFAAVDQNGNIYVTTNLEVQVFDTHGKFVRRFGSFGTGPDQFRNPRGIAIDADGNIIVVDRANHRLQVFNSAGQHVRSFGSFGTGDGQFNAPMGVAIDRSGRIYVTDVNNYRIQVLNSQGNFLFSFGNGQFSSPSGIAIAGNGDIVVSNDGPDSYIQVFSSTGQFIRKFGETGGLDGQFRGAQGVYVDANNRIYVADNANSRVQVFNANGSFYHKFGVRGISDGQLQNPAGLAPGPNNTLYVTGSNRVQQFSFAGNFMMKFGSWGTGDGQWGEIAGIAASDQNIYLLDPMNSRVQVFDFTGQYLRQFNYFGHGNNIAVTAVDIEIDISGNILVADGFQRCIMVFDANGAFIRRIGSTGSGDGQFLAVSFISTDKDGKIYVADNARQCIHVLDAAGNFLRRFGSLGSGDDQLYYINGMDVDSDGKIYVSDIRPTTVKVFSNEGVFVKKIGSAGPGPGRFSLSPGEITIGSDDLLYVADAYGFTEEIEVFDNTGQSVQSIGSLGNADRQTNGLQRLIASASSLLVADGSRVLVFPAKVQHVLFEPLPVKKYLDQPFLLTANASSGLPVSYSSSNSAVATISGNMVTITGAGTTTITASQNGNHEFWQAVPVNQMLTVAKADQAIDFPTIEDKIITDRTFTLQATSSSGLPISYISLDPTRARVNGSVVTMLSTGTARIQALQGGNVNFNAAPVVENSFRIRDRQTINFAPIPDKMYGDAPFDLPVITTSSGLPVTYTCSNEQVVTITGNTIHIHNAGTATITARHPGDDLLAPAAATQPIFVSKAWQMLTVAPVPVKRYGDAPFTLEAVSDRGLPVSFVSLEPGVVEMIGATATITGAGSAVISVEQPGTDNYFPAFELIEINVEKGLQTISFELPTMKRYGDVPFELPPASSAGLPVTYTSSDPHIVTISSNRATIKGVGAVSITASQGGNENYEAAEIVIKQLQVDKGLNEIAFGILPSKTIGDAPFTVMATASSGLPLRLSTTGPNVTLNGLEVSLVQPGSATLVAEQEGNENYLPASSIARSFCINPARPAIELGYQGKDIILNANVEGEIQWYKNNTLIAGATSKSIVAPGAGQYSVTVSVDGCTSARSAIVDIKENTSGPFLFPNPVGRELHIDLRSTRQDDFALVQIYDTRGQVLFSSSIAGGGQRNIATSFLKAGLYFVRVKTSDREIVKKIIKVH